MSPLPNTPETPDEVYEKFWIPLFEEHPEIPVDRQIRNELSDYYHQMDEWSEALCELTGGLLGKTNYTAQVMINAVNDHQNRCENTNTKEMLKELRCELMESLRSEYATEVTGVAISMIPIVNKKALTKIEQIFDKIVQGILGDAPTTLELDINPAPITAEGN